MVEETSFEEAATHLHTAQFGKRIVSVQSLASTNDLARQEAERGAPEGTVVVAEEQTRGRGRLSRSWYSPAGLGIWMSIVLRPEASPEVAPAITLCGSLAVARAVRALHPVTVSLKWPNDVLLKGRKLCGILTEMRVTQGSVEYVVCGMGINVNQTFEDFPSQLRETAISILMATGKESDRTKLFVAVIEHMEMLYRKFCHEGVSVCLDEWRSMCPFFGSRMRIKTRTQLEAEAEAGAGATAKRTVAGRTAAKTTIDKRRKASNREETTEGIFFDIDSNGALVLRLDSGVHRRFLAGDVELVSYESEEP